MLSENFLKIKRWLKKYERHISSLSLLVGFIVDNLTLRRIDLLFENLVFVFYLTLSFLCIVLFNLYKNETFKNKILEFINPFLPIVMQFAFGGLFSGFIVFYSRSASLFSSWPFLFVLVGILFAGEFVHGFYARLGYQSIMFFTGLFSFLIFYVPLLTKTLSELTFLISGIASLILFYIFFRFVSFVAPKIIEEEKTRILAGVVTIFVFVNIFYFTNILPPIPLSLKDGGVYHFVGRTSEGYIFQEEKKDFFDSFRFFKEIHISPGSSVYVFSSVFAPTNLNTNIVHEWQYFDDEKSTWITANTVAFPIYGGKDGGYGGYSIKTKVFPGKWRVNVNTERGQVVGRIMFKIIYADQNESIIETIYK